MSEQELSAEEKRRLLRERRQAKMAKGKASERLNDILSQGSSVKSGAVVSKLDEPKPEPEVETPASAVSSNNDHNDPEIQDIDTVANKDSIPEDVDIDKILQNMLSGNPNAVTGNNSSTDDLFAKMMSDMMKQGPGGNEGGAGGAGGADDMFQKMMGNFMNPLNSEGGNMNDDSEEAQYQRDLAAYNSYQQRLWKFRFLVARTLLTITNFFYHFHHLDDSFMSSSYSYVRGIPPTSAVSSFITFFFTSEIVILASYYIVCTNIGTFKNARDNGWIGKGISMGSMFLPQLEQFKPLIFRFLGYFELIKMFLGDVCIIIVLYGLLSFLR